MRSVNAAEMRSVEGGKTYVCKCGYRCYAWYQCVAHTCTKHYVTVLKLWGKLYSAACGLFGL